MGGAMLAAIAADASVTGTGAAGRGGGAVLARASDVVIDFTTPEALAEHLAAARAGKAAIVVGTTGLSDADHAAIDAAARDIAVLQTANTSLGVAALARLVAAAAAALPDWDIEIVDVHHRAKRDAPSGTALLLGAAAATARGTTLAIVRLPPHDGNDAARSAGGIGFAAVRGGSVAGDHIVMLAGDGERIELIHRAESRAVFAAGAVRAAVWLARQPPGRYAMADVLETSTGADVLETSTGANVLTTP